MYKRILGLIAIIAMMVTSIAAASTTYNYGPYNFRREIYGEQRVAGSLQLNASGTYDVGGPNSIATTKGTNKNYSTSMISVSIKQLNRYDNSTVSNSDQGAANNNCSVSTSTTRFAASNQATYTHTASRFDCSTAAQMSSSNQREIMILVNKQQ